VQHASDSFDIWHETEEIREDGNRGARLDDLSEFLFIETGGRGIEVDEYWFVSEVHDYVQDRLDRDRRHDDTAATWQVELLHRRPNCGSGERKDDALRPADVRGELRLCLTDNGIVGELPKQRTQQPTRFAAQRVGDSAARNR